MIDPAPLWADPRLTYTVAALAVLLLLAAIWLFGRRKRQGRQAGVICLSLSIALHLALIILVPRLSVFRGQASNTASTGASTDESLASFQFFDPDVLYGIQNCYFIKKTARVASAQPKLLTRVSQHLAHRRQARGRIRKVELAARADDWVVE